MSPPFDDHGAMLRNHVHAQGGDRAPSLVKERELG